MKKYILLIILITISCKISIAQLNGKRYLEEVFTNYDLVSNISYGIGSKNIMDVYSGRGDNNSNRPLIIFIHGGGFKDGDKVSNFGTRVCSAMAKRGYFVASINYRTTSTQNTDQQSFEAMIKAIQDAKAAVRFFRKNSSQYGIDTTQIFATGSSAGSITALHMAYLDANELPSFVTDPALKDIEGTSGNPGYSSKIHGVINNWGAIADTSWMDKGNVPVFSVHGLNDVTVYYDKIPSYGPFAYGSKYILEAAKRIHISSGIRLFNNTGHTLDNSSAKQDSAIKDFSSWLYTILKKETTGKIDTKHSSIPFTARLHQNYPNPFNPTTQIEYEVGEPGFINLTVYDSLGKAVKTLVNRYLEKGAYIVSFNAEEYSSGIYFSTLSGSKYSESKKMILQK